MGTGRRLAVLLVVLGLIGIPAAVLRIGCAGASCHATAAVAAPAPFCSLPTGLRTLITAGTYEGRSPDALAVAAGTPVTTDVGDGVEVPWPSGEQATTDAVSVPLAFVGPSVRGGVLPHGVGLDQIAPTLEPLLGIVRPHPEVRAGAAIPGVVRSGARAPLVVLIVWKGVGAPDQRARFRASDARIHETAGNATVGSLPLDPVAVEATIGTGGLPSQHGITGTTVRARDGRVATAFGAGAPQPVIASLGDDLDRATAGAARIGLISTETGDAALTGDGWYGTGPIVDRRIRAGADPARDVTGFLRRGWGADRTPDLLAIALDGSFRTDDTAARVAVDAIVRAVPDATVVITATGSLRAHGAVAAAAPPGTDVLAAGGAFVDRGAGSTATSQNVVDGFRNQTAPDGSPLFRDAFASYAVRFGRYC